MKPCCLITLLTILVISFHSKADYNYTYYQRPDGLCDECVLDILEDSKGFMWFCTSNGLDRFDGNDFVHYSILAPVSEHRTLSNYFRGIVEDKSGYLWAISDAGLSRISLDNGIIKQMTEVNGNVMSALSQRSYAITVTESGHLWISNEKEILCLTLDGKGNITRMESVSTAGMPVVTMCGRGNTVWGGGDHGISRFVVTADGSIAASSLGKTHPLNNVREINKIALHSYYMHIGTRNDGLYCYDFQSGNIEHFRSIPGSAESVLSDNISAISVKSSGDIIIGTDNGINILNPGNRIRQLKNSHDSLSISDNIVNCVYIDTSDNIWVGTRLGGINLISHRDAEIRNIFDGKAVTCINQDRHGNIFAGTINDGLGILYAGTGMPVYYKNTPTDEMSIAGNEIVSIEIDKAGNLWIGTRNNGLDLLMEEDIHSPRFTHFTATKNGLTDNRIRDLAVDSVRDGIWVCMENSIGFIDVPTRKFHPLRDYIGEEIGMSSMQAILLDNDSRLWAGGNILLIVDLKSSDKCRFKLIGYKLDDPESCVAERISDIYEAVDGSIYIGSLNNGLYHTDPGDGIDPEFVNFPLVFGTKITNIIDAGNDHMWICSNDAIYYHEPATYRSIKYDLSDGLPQGSFCIKSGFRLDDGSMCLGTTSGATLISPPWHYTTPEDRHVTITYVRTNDRIIFPDKNGIYNLYPDDTFVEIGVSAQEYVSPSKVLYAYKIKEIETVWNVEPQARRVRYNGMKPGDYTFTIHCTNADNRWSDIESELKIKVHAPFYQTTWFYCMCVGVVVLVLCIISYRYLVRQHSLQRTLIRKVQQRTKRLTEQTAKLRQQNLEIRQQKLQLEEFSQQIEKADKDKLKLFTSLTHEFKTPLTLILGPLNKIEKQNENPLLNENINIISRNAHHLLSLVNQIIDVRKIDSGKLQPANEAFDIVKAFNEDLAAFADLISERNIKLESATRIIEPVVVSDRNFLHKILFNLISNAIKHTPNGGYIAVRMAQKDMGNELFHYVSVNNTGSYISPEEVNKIFDCFYKIESQSTYTSYGQSSTGIGLFLVKHIVEVLNGKISVRSHPERGTSFRVCYPVSKVREHKLKMGHGSGDVTLRPVVVNAAEDIPFITPPDNDKPLLLLVEDSRDMRTYIKQLLNDRYYIAEAINGKRGYALAKEIMPDFIISDIMMPECDGFEFCHMIRTDPELSHIPILVLTALSDEGVRVDSYKVGIDAFLTKPFDSEMLLARIDAVLVNRRNQQKLIANELGNPYPIIEIEGPDKIFLKRLMSAVEENYSDPDFGPKNLVEIMSMSSHSFYNKINSLTGMPATSFIRCYRLRTAQRIMDDNRGKKGISISEIAYLVGFNDPKYFTRCFVKEFGIQPRVYMNGDSQKHEDTEMCDG